ncbi:hypothetical protein DOTSEDRAFT_25398 [Dothistroma septosporum NZE10]|uniref:Uncharacterized protein n=1 Tax=Dothistroma septosporum (strain NZE10 / CBS 128990) TaxID=675120 RepID=M2XLZ5_DOTSN|nr:hypothetical protein DOTSEDRAFT_25398 [Dothistroma septosporum NZE10]
MSNLFPYVVRYVRIVGSITWDAIKTLAENAIAPTAIKEAKKRGKKKKVEKSKSTLTSKDDTTP